LESLYHAAPQTDAPPTLHYALRRSRATPGYEAASPGRPLFGPAALPDAWAFLEWCATEDLLNAAMPDGVFLHAAGADLGGHLTLIIGDSGAGKSTLVTHLLSRGHRMLGDDVVRFATEERVFSAVGRSVKLDDNTLRGLPFVSALCATGRVGTLLAAGCYYVSPASIRGHWQAEPARPRAVVLLDATTRAEPVGLRRSSEGEAAVMVTQKVLAGSRLGPRERSRVASRLLESLVESAAYRAAGSDPGAVAEALEEEIIR
jgi:hypothetical protein